MQTSNAKQNFRSNDPEWVLLADLSLGDFLLEHDRRDEPAAGYLFQTVQELGMPLECVENIAMLVTQFAKESPVYYQLEGSEFPGRIRIFCQKKMINDANSAKPSRPHRAEQGKKQKQIFPDFRANTTGGWGYFIIERGEDPRPDPSAIPHNSIDLYLYKEGE